MWGKFDRPFTRYLYERVVLEGRTDEFDSHECNGDWIDRVGRRIVTGDDRGFVVSRTFATVGEAQAVFAEVSESYYEHDDEEEEDEDVDNGDIDLIGS